MGFTKIIPLKMSEVIAMNKEVIKYTPMDGASQKCHGCDEVKEGLSKCGGCGLFFYCNKVSQVSAIYVYEMSKDLYYPILTREKECQINSWTEKGHKKFCKVLKDKNVRFIHFLDYDAHSGLSGDIVFS